MTYPRTDQRFVSGRSKKYMAKKIFNAINARINRFCQLMDQILLLILYTLVNFHSNFLTPAYLENVTKIGISLFKHRTYKQFFFFYQEYNKWHFIPNKYLASLYGKVNSLSAWTQNIDKLLFEAIQQNHTLRVYSLPSLQMKRV